MAHRLTRLPVTIAATEKAAAFAITNPSSRQLSVVGLPFSPSRKNGLWAVLRFNWNGQNRELRIGDTHAAWPSHADTALQQKTFADLWAVLSTNPGRALTVEAEVEEARDPDGKGTTPANQSIDDGLAGSNRNAEHAVRVKRHKGVGHHGQSRLERASVPDPTRRSDRSSGLFDAFVMVDWSSNDGAKKGDDSIWWCTAEWSGTSLLRHKAQNPSTRQKAFVELFQELQRLAGKGSRVLLGFDVAFGYPSGLASALGLSQPSWLELWREWVRLVSDLGESRNARFEVASRLNERLTGGHGPFWGHPEGRTYAHLAKTKPPNGLSPGLPAKRITERRHRNSKSTWQLCYKGGVGGQVICGLPYLFALRHAPGLAPYCTVWPFETGFETDFLQANGPQITLAEVYPSLLTTGDESDRPPDEVQVLELAARFAELDARGELSSRFARPEGLSEAEVRIVVEEEGWILEP